MICLLKSAGCHDGINREPPDLKVCVCSKCLFWCAIAICILSFSLGFFSRTSCSDSFCNIYVNVLLVIVHIFLLILHVIFYIIVVCIFKCYSEKLNHENQTELNPVNC